MSVLEFKLHVLKQNINESLESIRLDIISSIPSKENFRHFIKKDLKINDHELEELITLQKTIFPRYTDPKSLLLMLRSLSILQSYKLECVRWFNSHITSHIHTIKTEDFVLLLDFVTKQHILTSKQILKQIEEELEKVHPDWDIITNIIKNNTHKNIFYKAYIHKLKNKQWKDFVFAVKEYNDHQFNNQKISFITAMLKENKLLNNMLFTRVFSFVEYVNSGRYLDLIDFVTPLDKEYYYHLLERIEKMKELFDIKVLRKSFDDLKDMVTINEEHWSLILCRMSDLYPKYSNMDGYDVHFMKTASMIEDEAWNYNIALVESFEDDVVAPQDRVELIKALVNRSLIDQDSSWVLDPRIPKRFSCVDKGGRNQFIKMAASSVLNKNEWDSLIEYYDNSITADVPNHCELLQFLSSITDEQDRKDLIDKIERLNMLGLIVGLSKFDFIDLIKVVYEVPMNRWSHLRERAVLLTPQLRLPDRIRLAYKFKEYDDQKWKDILAKMNSLRFVSDISFSHYEKLIQVIHETQDEQWSSIVANIQSLMQQGYDSCDCIRLVKEFMFIESATFLQSIEKINQLKAHLSVDEFLIGDYINLIKVSSSVDHETWSSLIQRMKPLIGRLEIYNYMILIKTLLELNNEEWIKSIGKVDFLTRELSKQNVTFPESSLSVVAVPSSFYSSLSIVDDETEEPLRILNFVNTFLDITPSQRVKESEEIESMDLNYFVEDYMDLIRCSAEMGNDLWHSAVHKAKWMITKKMNAHDQIKFIRVAAVMNDSVWESSIKKADILFTPTIGVTNRIEIIRIAERLIQGLGDKADEVWFKLAKYIYPHIKEHDYNPLLLIKEMLGKEIPNSDIYEDDIPTWKTTIPTPTDGKTKTKISLEKCFIQNDVRERKSVKQNDPRYPKVKFNVLRSSVEGTDTFVLIPSITYQDNTVVPDEVCNSVLEPLRQAGIRRLSLQEFTSISSSRDFSAGVGEGDKDEQFNLGLSYYLGINGIEQNRDNALQYFNFSAADGHLFAQHVLEVDNGLDNGIGQLLFEQYNQAINENNPAAANLIGDMYYEGNYVQKNLEEALRWYQLSANQGNQEAQEKVAFLTFIDEEV